MNMGVLQYYFSMKALLWVLVVFFQTREYMGCLEEERVGLLHLKSFLIISIPSLRGYNLDYDHLPSWVGHEKSDCCDWERITCNSTTGHVIELSLENLRQGTPDYNSFYWYEEHPWLLNVSLLEPFKELRSLDLSFNAIDGCIPDEGFEKLSTLRNLEILNLGYNMFGHDNSILQSLGAITSLKTLNLTLNLLEGYFPAQGFERLAVLRNLETLILDGNSFDYSNIIPSLSNLTSLMTLSLSGNYSIFDEGVLNVEELVTLRNLNTLDISWNWYNGSLPNQGFERLAVLRNLETLILDGNRFGGRYMSNLTSLIDLGDVEDRIIPSLSGLTSLTTLSLASNGLQGGGEGWKMLSRLENLEILDLSGNSLNYNSSCLQSIVAIKSLKNLNLAANNGLGQSFPTKDWKMLSRLENLEILDLGYNSLNDTSFLQSIAAIKSLKTLNLESNELTGSFPSKELANLSNLEILILRGNHFGGRLPMQEFCALKKLEVLDLSYNYFEGILPPCINNMTSLVVLDISNNQFNEIALSSYVEASQASLQYIDFSYNQFVGIVSFNLFANYSKLEILRFNGQNNTVEIETEGSMGWSPLFQLKIIELSNCRLNKLTGSFSKFLHAQNELDRVALSHNKLEESFPNWLVENNTRLQLLDLRNNSFMGQLYLPSLIHMNMIWMDVSTNHLEGKLQENIGKIFPNLVYLNLSNNNLEGNLPSSIGGMLFLEVLDVSSNNFSGGVPRGLNTSCWLLSILNFAHNSFNGEIFIGTNWEVLKMNDNQFTSITPVHNSTIYLSYLDISNNRISDTIPRWLGNTSYLRTLVMANNRFYGPIPCELSMIGTLDLSHNLFMGLLPFCLNLPELEHLYLQGNKFTGSIPKVLFNSSSLLTLDIGDNNFTGSISVEIEQLQNLKVLLLSGNRFTGILPNQLCLLRMISIMDLSKNAFSGTIPQCLHDIYFGKTTALSVDYFSEKVDESNWDMASTYRYKGFSSWAGGAYQYLQYVDVEVEIEFVTKYRRSSYKGFILGYMSGLDLSCNKLTGGIPSELGQISSLHALNLSYNQLTGTIPESFSKMTSLESLDLSRNSLSGEIPSTLIDLTFLEIFNVANNNLSGKVPDMKAQFATFEKNSYEGNLFLCGPPLDKSCDKVDVSYPTQPQSSNASDKKWYEVDHVVFHTSFLVTYIIFFFSVISLVYINPYWLQRCSNLIEDLIFDGYYFVIWKLKNFLCM